MTTPYVGTPTRHASITQVTNADTPSGGLFATPYAQLADMVELLFALSGHSVAPTTDLIPIAAAGISTGHSATGAIEWFYNALSDGTGWVQNSVVSPELVIELDYPVGTVITGVQANLKGGWNGNTHASVAGHTMPTISLVSIDANGVRTLEQGPVSDGSTTVGQLDTLHSLIVGPFSETIQAGKRYCVIIRGEAGANAVARSIVVRSVQVDRSGP